jgi:hypothetical protein
MDVASWSPMRQLAERFSCSFVQRALGVASANGVTRIAGVLAALSPLIVQPACADHPGEVRAAPASIETASSALYAEDETLWPLDPTGKAVIEVCWAKAEIGQETFPDTAPNLDAALAQRKSWVEQIVRDQWNARTQVQFLGWKDCPANGKGKAIRIVPITSAVTPSCAGASGQSCVDAIGKAGTTLWLNLFFGVETESVVQAMIEDPNDQAAIGSAWDIFYPLTCFPEGDLALNQPSPQNLSYFQQHEQRCVQSLALHELGHVAGFAHEQNRDDDPKAESACVQLYGSLGLDTTLPDEGVAGHGDHPLGKFDPESIMSYCRTNPMPILSDQDVTGANTVYAAPAPPPAKDPGTDSDTTSGPPTTSTAVTPAARTPRKTNGGAVSVPPPSGGCLG